MASYSIGNGVDFYGAAVTGGVRHAIAAEFISKRKVNSLLQRERGRTLCSNAVGAKQPVEGEITCKRCKQLVKSYRLTLREAVAR